MKRELVTICFLALIVLPSVVLAEADAVLRPIGGGSVDVPLISGVNSPGFIETHLPLDTAARAATIPPVDGTPGFIGPSVDPRVLPYAAAAGTPGAVGLSPAGAASINAATQAVGGAMSIGGGLQYHLLEKVNDVLDVGKAPSITEYINAAFSWFLTLIAVISILLLIVYGIAYASTTGEAMKSIMKGKLTGVMYGVGIGLSAWLLLQFVNPQINNGGVKSLDDLKALMPKATGGTTVGGASAGNTAGATGGGTAMGDLPTDSGVQPTPEQKASFEAARQKFAAGDSYFMRVTNVAANPGGGDPIINVANTNSLINHMVLTKETCGSDISCLPPIGYSPKQGDRGFIDNFNFQYEASSNSWVILK